MSRLEKTSYNKEILEKQEKRTKKMFEKVFGKACTKVYTPVDKCRGFCPH